METVDRKEVQALLEAAVAAVPYRQEPHPCTVRCWRVGVAIRVDERGVCAECSHDGVMSEPRALAELVAARPDMVVRVCEELLLLREGKK